MFDLDRRVTTQDISWILDLNRNDQLDLNPSYQRRSVWSTKDKRFFLDTIFRGYPSPSIFLHKEIIDGKTIYHVVDGKQRLETIIRFTLNKISLEKDYGDIRLNGKKWEEIKKDTSLARQFWNYVVPVEFINMVENSTLVNEVFDRLNRNSRKLSEQERRHAKYEGWFISFAEREAQDIFWETLNVATVARTRRMADVQFISELLIVIVENKIIGFDQNILDEYYAKYEDLEEMDSPLDGDIIKNKFAETKNYLMDMVRSNNSIIRYANDATNLYSLWVLLAMYKDRLPAAPELANKYSAFLEDVSKFKDQTYLEKIIHGQERPIFEQSLPYYQNSIGARTEEPQRLARNEALINNLLG
jgi:hypothetical protein